MSQDNLHREVLAERPAAVATLVPTKSDAVIAEDLKRRVPEALAPIMELMNEAKMHGFEINFGLGQDFAGKCIIAQVLISKRF